MTDDKDIRIIALKCPNCGGVLDVSPESDRATCGHCGGEMLLVHERDDRTGEEAVRPEATMSDSDAQRVVKVVLWGTVISAALPIVVTAVIIVVIAVIFLVLGLIFTGTG
ncbi:MAG: hypothetical protein JW765_08465 [Deltaproteobacteria bacterium]|nr:hypothetical protein [Candidatus Zymogenaceae bacterium]